MRMYVLFLTIITHLQTRVSRLLARRYRTRTSEVACLPEGKRAEFTA